MIFFFTLHHVRPQNLQSQKKETDLHHKRERKRFRAQLGRKGPLKSSRASMKRLEVNKEQPNENKQGRFIQNRYNKGVSHCHLHFDRDPKTGRRLRKLLGKKGNASGVL